MTESQAAIKKMFSSFGNANEGALSYINQHVKKTIVQKGDILIKPDEICTHVYYIEKGIFRGYIKEGKKEITTWITSEGELVTAIRSFYMQKPTKEIVQAIEESTVLSFPHSGLQILYDRHPGFNMVIRKLLEAYYCDAEERAYINRLSNAHLKYRHFLHTKGDLLNRIPLKYIASYLGMTLETLSRIRSHISNDTPRSNPS